MENNEPGPLAPPIPSERPNLNITALSYSLTIFKQQHMLNGNVKTIRA